MEVLGAWDASALSARARSRRRRVLGETQGPLGPPGFPRVPAGCYKRRDYKHLFTKDNKGGPVTVARWSIAAIVIADYAWKTQSNIADYAWKTQCTIADYAWKKASNHRWLWKKKGNRIRG